MSEAKNEEKIDKRGHLCVLSSEKRTEEIKALVKNPEYVCFNCGRAARSKKNLCNPMPLNE